MTIKIPGIGPVKAAWVYAGIGVTAGILLLAYWRHAQAPAAEPAEPAAEETAADAYAQYSDAAGYNTVFPSAYSGEFSSRGYDLYGNPLPPPTGATGAGGLYQTNAQWSDAAVDYLERTGVTEQVAALAISSVLGGLPVTSDQQAMYLRAVGLLSQPPQGAPPIRLKDTPAQPTPPTAPPAAPPGKSLRAPTGLRVISRTSHTVRADWNSVQGARAYAVFLAHDPPGGGDALGREQGRITGTAYTLRGLRAGARYRVDVHAVGADGQLGARARLYAWTKK